MMLFLTGASSSLINSGGTPQSDSMKSLGGYVSNSPVPNGALNSLFDFVSLKSIKDRTKETIAIALINKFNEPVYDVSLKVVCSKDSSCSFKVSAVSLNSEYCMEHINNRYSQPMMAEFHDATFNSASVDVEIIKLPIKDEEVHFSPFEVTVQFTESTYDAVINDIIKEFNKTNVYKVKRLSEKVFRIERNDDTTIAELIQCSYISSDDAEFKFLDFFRNDANKEVFLVENLEPNQGIGLWIQREVLDDNEKTNIDLINDYNKKITKEIVEEIELVINYNVIKPQEPVDSGTLDGGRADTRYGGVFLIDCGEANQ